MKIFLKTIFQVLKDIYIILEIAFKTCDELCGLESDNSDIDNCPGSYVGKDDTEWCYVPSITGRTASHNIIRGGLDRVVLLPGKHIDLPIDGVLLFFNDDVINTIVK